MASVKFKARQIRAKQVISCLTTRLRTNPKDIPNYFGNKIVLEIEDKDERDAVIAFFKQKYEHEKESGQDRSLSCELQIWYKRRSIDQWRLYMELVHRKANTDQVDWRTIHAGIRGLYYPRVGPVGRTVPKDTDDLSTKDMAIIIRGAVLECSQGDPPVDISDIWVLWKDFLGRQKEDPLEGAYKDEADYIQYHPYCEICGKGLVESEAPNGAMQREGQLMHIVSRGAGGPDDLDNRILGCTNCHIEDQHQVEGWNGLIAMYPYLENRIRKAFEKHGGEHKIITSEAEKTIEKEDNENEQLEIF